MIDPVFFLHHAQLDRLWWLWQHRSLSTRERDYAGVTARNSTTRASLTDIIKVGGLGKDLETKDVMSTRNQLLCYKY